MNTDSEVLVAPQEIQELLSRLTEYRVDSLAIDEPRTLAGLAANTGIPVARLQSALDEMRGRKKARNPWMIALPTIAIGVIAFFVATAKPKAAAVVPPEAVPITAPVGTNIEGLVALTQVTYGPDNGTQLVDPTFEPSVPMPKGVGAYATTGNVLWGAGDRLAVAIHAPLNTADESALRTVLGEMLAKVRSEATRRKLPQTDKGLDPLLSFTGSGFMTQVSIDTFNGSSGVSLKLPPEGTGDADAQRVIKRAVERAVTELQESLRWQAGTRRDRAPRG